MLSTIAMFMGTRMEAEWAVQAEVRIWAAARERVGRAVVAGADIVLCCVVLWYGVSGGFWDDVSEEEVEEAEEG